MSRSERPFKRIWGIAYKNVLKGDNPTRQILANRSDRDQLYNDPAIRLSEADIQRFKTLVGKPICVEHDQDEVVGHIHHYEVSSDGHLRVMARIFTDTEAGVQAAKKLERGELNGLSVGYTTGIVPGTANVASKHFDELTLTEEPFFEGCYVSVQASKNPTYKTNSIWITLSKEEKDMSEVEQEQQQVPKEVPKMAEVPQKEASSLLKVADDLKEEVTTAKSQAEKESARAVELSKELEQLKKEKAILEEYKRQEEQRYAAEKKPEAEEVLALHEEMQGQPFPEAVRQEMVSTMCSKDPHKMHNAKILCSQAFAYKSQKEAVAKANAEREELIAKMKQMEEDNALATARIQASKKDLYGMRQTSAKGKEEEMQEEEERLEINAHRGSNVDPNFPYRGLHMTDVMIPNPSRMELDLPYFEHTPASTLSVTASKTSQGTQMTISAVPRSKYDKELPNSMRNSRNAAWFHLMAGNFDQLMSGPEAVTHHVVERKDKEYL